MTSKRPVITGPNIDKLASGIYKPEMQGLRQKLYNAQQKNAQLAKTNARINHANQQLERTARAARNAADSLRKDLATSRETRAKYTRENLALKSVIQQVRTIHRPVTHHFHTPAGSVEVCEACRWEYPCPTIQALGNWEKP